MENQELKSLGDNAAELKKDQKIAHLEAKVRSQEERIKRLLRAEGEIAEQMVALREAVVAVDPFPHVPYIGGNDSSSPIEGVLKSSDWQTGEVIDEEETEGFGKYNWKIQQNRVLDQLTPKVIDWIKTQRHAYQIDRFHIFSEGDPISGNIHKELEITNEFTVMEATANAGKLFGEMCSQLAPHFKEVVVWALDSDNHGRLDRKPQAKQKARNNYGYLVHEIADLYLKKHTNIRFVRSKASKFIAKVNNKRFLLLHGDTIKGWMGTPYYGIDREKMREALKRMNFPEKSFDYMSMGHWHVPAFLNGMVLINGALTGTTEFDHLCGRHAEPSQMSFLVHPKWGLFNMTPWKLR